jgi:hypothetical protein
MYNALSQNDIGRAGVANQAQQLKLSAVDSANRNALGIAQLTQQGDIARAQIASQDKRFAAMDAASQARLLGVRNNALNTFTKEVAPQLNTQFVREYGPNWRTAKDPRSLEAQLLFKQQENAYLSQATGLAMDAMSARQADALLMGQ